MLAQYLDLSDDLNNNGFVYVELSNYDYAIVQAINLGDDIKFYSTISEGAYEGDNIFVSVPDNWSPIYCVNLSDDSIVPALASVPDGLYRIDVVGKHLQIQGGTNVDQRLLVMLAKIS